MSDNLEIIPLTDNSDNTNNTATTQITLEIKNHDSQLFNSCYNTIKGWIKKDETLDTKNILDFTVKVIKLIQKLEKQKNKGAYKKQLVIDLVTRLVTEINYPTETTRQLVLQFIDITLPGFIDITISVATGELNIGKKCKKIKKWCSCLQCY